MRSSIGTQLAETFFYNKKLEEMFCRLLSMIALLAATTASFATPVKFGFTGVVTARYIAETGQPDPTQVGRAFSGSYTLDVDTGQPEPLKFTQSGCRIMRNHICESNAGQAAPVVTDWSIVMGNEQWSLADNGPWFRKSFSSLTQFGQDILSEQTSVEIDAYYTRMTTSWRYFAVTAEYANPGTLPSDHLTPDLTRYDSVKLAFIDLQSLCLQPAYYSQCLGEYSTSGVNFYGTLTSWSLADTSGSSQVPEPSSLPLLALGLGAAAGVSRKFNRR